MNKPKNCPVDNEGKCIWCNKSITIHDSGWVYSRAKRLRYFHLSCYYKHTIGARNDRTKKSNRASKLF